MHTFNSTTGHFIKLHLIPGFKPRSTKLVPDYHSNSFLLLLFIMEMPKSLKHIVVIMMELLCVGDAFSTVIKASRVNVN